jgi:HNH endonuclease
MSYARYLLCIKERRLLEAWEEADHKDDDRRNDDPDNLQVLTKRINIQKSAKGRTMVVLVCAECDQSFERELRQTYSAKRGARTFCSRRCMGLKMRREQIEAQIAKQVKAPTL